MNRTLFDIGADLLKAYGAIAEPPDGAPWSLDGASDYCEYADSLIENPINEWFDHLHEEEAAKLDNYLGLLHQLDMEATAAQAQAEQWKAKADSRRSRVAWLKARLLGHLVATGREKVLTASGRIVAVQANGGKVPLVCTEDVGLIPVEYLINKPVVNTELVRKRLEAGECLDFASLGERGRHLRIR